MRNIAIILAAGRGTRLRPLTDTVPKCMVSGPEGIPLLHRTVTKLQEVDTSEIILGLGFQEDAVTIPDAPGVMVHRVVNDIWDQTNNIYTLKVCIDYIRDKNIPFDNVFLIEGDVCLGDSVLPRLLIEKCSATVVMPCSYLKRGSCVAVDDMGFVTRLGDNRDWNDPSIFKTANVYKLTHDDCIAIGDQLDSRSRSGYYEVVIGDLLGRLRLKAVIEGDCREIDNSYDRFSLLDGLKNDYDSVRGNQGGMWRRSIRDHSSIANPYYPSEFIKDRLRYALNDLISNYPSRRSRLDEMLRAFCNVDPSFPLYATTGGAEGIRVLEQYFRACAVKFRLHFTPPSDEYCRFPLSDGSRAEGVIVVSPNSATGQKVTAEKLRQLSSDNRYVILDLSLSTEKDTAYLNLIDTAANLVIVRSLSDIMGIPGIRLGYVAAHPSTVEGLEELLPVWNANSIAEGFLELHLDSLSDYEKSITAWGRECERVYEQLRLVLPQKDIDRSDTFVTVVTDVDLPRRLYDQYGIFVADVTPEAGGGRYRTRLAIRSTNENDYLMYALKETVATAQSAVIPAAGSGS